LKRTVLFFLALFGLLLAARLCHVGILWEGDSYPLAAAVQMLHGKALYRGIWFDKPPLLAAFYVLEGARIGWPLRLAGALYALLACWIAYAFGRDLWTRREGFWAAGLLSLFLIFDFPSAAIPVASDLLMLAPQLAALWILWKKRPFWAGVMGGIAFWINPKGVFVLAACALWMPVEILWILCGFAAVGAFAVAVLWSFGALGAYWREVWVWGRLYAASTFLESPLRSALVRTAGWIWFHAALVAAAAWFLWRDAKLERVRWIGWVLIALAGVAAGLRFFPRYYFLLLPPMVLMAARGFTTFGRRRDYLALLLLIPMTRFGPSYLAALANPAWRDTAMDRESRAAAATIRAMSTPGDTLFIWGYRPEIYVYTRLPAATIYLDSQPLTGVPADRHLTQSEPVETGAPARRRAQLAQSRPSFIVDGLGPYNPRLAITQFPDLHAWLADYRLAGRSGNCVIYRRK
jgi:hypothetical protein